MMASQDLDALYSKVNDGSEIFLWCDAKVDKDKAESSKVGAKRVHETVSKRQEKTEQVDEVFEELKQNHSQNYSTPQLRLWARMIGTGIHDMDDPPRVPMITGCIPKRPKKECV